VARILSMPQVEALILDLDETMYQCPKYSAQRDQSEMAAMARVWGVTYETAAARFDAQRKNLTESLGRKASRNETAASFGFSLGWWNEIREQSFSPELYLSPNEHLVRCLSELSKRYKVAVASNSPTPIVHRVLDALGLGSLKKTWVVIGTNDGKAKPDSDLYALAAELLSVAFDRCLSVGDREDMDGWPAMKLGMGAIIVDDVNDLIGLLENLLSTPKPNSNFDISKLLGLYRSGEVVSAGFTGQAGAGKTTNAELAHRVAFQKDIPTAHLPLDAFFRKSSKGRKAWLEEGKKLGEQEFARRADQMTWWDFDRFQESLAQLSKGRDLHLDGVYNRADGGELTGTISIKVPRKGLMVVCEGVAIGHLSKSFHQLVYLHARPEVRTIRLGARDAHRKGPEAEERFRITQEFERRYFSQHMDKPHMFVDTSGSMPTIMGAPPSVSQL
jgi:FMN phosphatase YigB (HAD superfamily)/uridine kinase